MNLTPRKKWNSTFKIKAAKPRPSFSEVQAKRRDSESKPFPELLAAAIAKRKEKGNGLARGQKRLGKGPRMKAWDAAWRWLKPRLEAAGRTRCEFDHLPHACSGILTPAHSKKRREIEGDEIYEVAIACTSAHQILDERLTHEQMYVCVNYAIIRAGGLILPVRKQRAAA